MLRTALKEMGAYSRVPRAMLPEGAASAKIAAVKVSKIARMWRIAGGAR